jgi:hypothetical protein
MCDGAAVAAHGILTKWGSRRRWQQGACLGVGARVRRRYRRRVVVRAPRPAALLAGAAATRGNVAQLALQAILLAVAGVAEPARREAGGQRAAQLSLLSERYPRGAAQAALMHTWRPR